VARIAGFVVASPFPGANVSHTQRVGLTLVLALLAFSFAPVAQPRLALDLTLAIPTASELGVGLVIGGTVRLLYFASEALGQGVSQASGLAMASVLNPAISGQDIALSRVITLLAELLALSAGVHRTAIAYLLHSFRVLPLGGTDTIPQSFPVLLDLVAKSTLVGLQLSMPVVGVCLVVHLGLAMIARAAPALQILHVGQALTLTAGFLTLLAVLPDLSLGLSAYNASLASLLDNVLSSLVRARP
jgi:flagellar biosynthetic protein FliR